MKMQDFLDVCYYVALFVFPIVLYALFFKPKNRRFYTNKDYFYVFKLPFANFALKKYQEQCRASNSASRKSPEQPRQIRTEIHADTHYIYGADQNGNSLSLKFALQPGLVAEVFLCVRLASGAIYTWPGDRIVRVFSISDWHWKVKDLQIDVLEDFRRVRVTYNGLLRNSATGSVDHVKFNLMWVCAAGPSFQPQDAATSLLVDALCQKSWKDGDWISLLGDERGYEQFGSLHGSISGDSFVDEQWLNLPACRSRFWGTADKLAVERSVRLFVAARDGALISVWVKAIRDGAELKHGFVIANNGIVYPISDTDVTLKSFASTHTVPALFTGHVSANGKVYRIVFHLNVVGGVQDHVSGLSNVHADCDVNAQQGKALVEFWSNEKTPRVTPLPLLVPNKPATVPDCYITHFDDERAKLVQLTGGKGSSLAILASLKSPNYVVPDGFVITVNAFNRQFQSDNKLSEAVAILDAICCGRTVGNLERACAETVQIIQDEQIPEDVKQATVEALQNVAQQQLSTKWAVRSSAICEDGQDLSAAGQNDTFLGCATTDDVIKAVAACWASLFSFQSVQYRHQHGLPVASQMAVVVQRMVPADCAGVLFTCHPSTANPALLVITSNYGLGESVVSGRSEPDTIVLKRTFDNEISVKTKSLGLKNEVIRMDVVTDVDNLQEFSITEEQALHLGKVGVLWEERLGHALDIEWAYYQGRLHLLQARPITTLSAWSEAELLHEFDSALLTEDLAYTNANVGEILPGAISTLGLTTTVRCVDFAAQETVQKKGDAYALKCLTPFQNHLFVDVVHFIHIRPSHTVDLMSKIIDLAIFGHPILNDTIQTWSLMRNGVTTTKQKIIDILTMIVVAWNNERYLAECKKIVGGVDLGVDEGGASPKDIYMTIDKVLRPLEDAMRLHCRTTRTSVTYQMIAMTVLAENSTDFTVDHYNDIAMLLSSCGDVVSAQVPSMLSEISQTLIKAGQSNEFCEIDPERGLTWLEANVPEAYKLLVKFLQEHGHRTMGELDVYQKPWNSDPAQVIKMIQTNCRSGTTKQEKTTKSLDQVVAELKSPTKSSTRKILKFLMKKGRRAVSIREQTKSEVVRFVDKQRKAYWVLARKMALRGLIPEPSLVFHLSHKEVGQIIDGSEQSPVLISKALKRQKLYPKWNQLTFPEISYGNPQPESREFVPRSGSSKVTCEGTPACSGTVQGRACVVRDLREIDQLRDGDILITFCTDIGWSPYFPMLAGVVTELGGLVSHGAVIAREYGLPCIVGAKGASKMFQTGNNVLLSGKNGTVELL